MSLSRRSLVVGGGGLIGLAAMPALSRPMAPTLDGRLVFDVSMDGSRIGTHQVTLTPDGDDGYQVAVDIDFAFKLAFITVRRYGHTNRELWRNGRLVRLDSRTDDDGEIHTVKATAAGDVIEVVSSLQDRTVPADTITTTYFSDRMIEADHWLDTTKGRYFGGTVTRRGTETVTAAGRPLQAERYRIDGDLRCDLWYHQGTWVHFAFELKGRNFVYDLRQWSGRTT